MEQLAPSDVRRLKFSTESQETIRSPILLYDKVWVTENELDRFAHGGKTRTEFVVSST